MTYDWKKAAKDHTLIAKIALRARKENIGPSRDIACLLATLHFHGAKPMPLNAIYQASHDDLLETVKYSLMMVHAAGGEF